MATMELRRLCPFLLLACFAWAGRYHSENHASDIDDQITLLQAATQATARAQNLQPHARKASNESKAVDIATAPHITADAEMWPFSLLHTQAVIRTLAPSSKLVYVPSTVQLGTAVLVIAMALVIVKRVFPGSNVFAAISLGSLYILCSAMMIESNKWLMLPGHFPYPVALTTSHMLMSFVLANCLRCACPAAFPSLQKIEVTRWFLLKFVPIGAAFALSLVCGNAAYKFLSVSFLQCMKQWNVVIIYAFSVLVGLEALRRCSIVLLTFIICGVLLAIRGQLHFELAGFVLQVISSLSEATKVIMQGVLMSGSLKLDALTMVLFMAPACLLTNIIPLAVVDVPRWGEIYPLLMSHWPFILLNACFAFGLNVIVAQCIKQLSPVGYLLCGIVKDVCIIVTSSFFLGESLERMQIIGFSIALSGVTAYSLYKQNLDCFDDDSVLSGFARVAQRLCAKPERKEAPSLDELIKAPMKQ